MDLSRVAVTKDSFSFPKRTTANSRPPFVRSRWRRHFFWQGRWCSEEQENQVSGTGTSSRLSRRKLLTGRRGRPVKDNDGSDSPTEIPYVSSERISEEKKRELYDEGEALHDKLEAADDHSFHPDLLVATAIDERSLNMEIEPLLP